MKRNKKKKQEVRMICDCGHYAEEHKSCSPWNGWCNECCCIEFRLDNLLYLEELNRISGMGHYNA